MGLFRKPSKKRVLVVEDEADIAEGLKARLELEGFDVLHAGDGQTAVETARREQPDAMILDVMIPKVDGFEVCRILKRDASTQSIPILILTALPQMNDVEQAFEAGATDFLNKPYSNDRLILKVYKLLKIPPPT